MKTNTFAAEADVSDIFSSGDIRDIETHFHIIVRKCKYICSSGKF